MNILGICVYVNEHYLSFELNLGKDVKLFAYLSLDNYEGCCDEENDLISVNNHRTFRILINSIVQNGLFKLLLFFLKKIEF